VFQSPLAAYADDKCTEPAAVSRTSPEGTMVRVVENNTCPAREVLYRTELLHAATKVFQKFEGKCEAVTIPEGARVFAVRDLVNNEDFVPFTESRAGTGRLQQRVLTSAEGTVDRLAEPFDTMFGETCSFGRGETGGSFCMPVPEPAQGVTEFSDSDCTSRVVAQRPGLSCTAAQQAAVVEGPWCGPIVRAKLLSGVDRTTFHRNPSGQCEASKPADYRGLAGDVPLTSFVEGIEVMM
jgi:hypothetical protein